MTAPAIHALEGEDSAALVPAAGVLVPVGSAPLPGLAPGCEVSSAVVEGLAPDEGPMVTVAALAVRVWVTAAALVGTISR